MAAKRRASEGGGGGGGQSNTGLVVSLVVFVLLTIFLGVLSYYGYSGRSEAQAAESKAKSDLTTMTKSRDEEKTRKLALRVATGNDQKDDQATLAGLKGQFGDAFTQETAGLKNLPRWDAALNRPTKTYQDMLADALTAKLAAEKALKDAETNFQGAQQQFEEYKKEMGAKLAKAEDALKKANAATVEAQNKKSEEFLAANVKIEEQGKLINELNTQIADLKVKHNQDMTKATETETNLKKVLEAKTAMLEPPQSINNDYPKGKIQRIDRASNLAYVNLGLADNAKQGLRFSIFPAAVGDRVGRDNDRKGALEIVTVLDQHLSTARFIDVTNANRDPILAGDLLFNPAWNPAQKEHIAIAGIIDIDGDGKDDTVELVRSLERQGIVVDAWLDVKERKIRGKINERTTYFVLGESYKVSSSIPITEDNPIFQAANELNGKIEEMKAQAREAGVQTVAYRRFLALIGFKLPKAQTDYSSTTYLRGPTGSLKGAAPKNGDKEAPKEETPK